MRYLSLCGEWRMQGGGYDCRGNIPGSLYSFLLNAGLMEDPYYRDNEYSALDLASNEYTFSRSFNAEVRSGEKYLLLFEGLDTFCTVRLNGKVVKTTDNMHVTYEIDVTRVIKNGENELSVTCHPVVDYCRKKSKEMELYLGTHTIHGFAYVRKAHCMLGWDWGPFLPDMGIWRPVYLVVKDSARITELHVTQRHEGARVFVTPKVTTDEKVSTRVTLTTPDGEEITLKANTECEIKNPKLWWPRGLGEQPLYTVKAEIISHGVVCDEKALRVGLRTLTIVREYDEWGQSFTHECNGVKFFAMGADYVPEDNVFSRITKERSELLLKRCADANFNAIRVWGGGYYPDDWFFDICDELGIVVFCDFMFACSLYYPDDKLMESIRVEVRQNLMRIRNHPSLAILSGNNEVEECSSGASTPDVVAKCKPKITELFYSVIPEIIAEVCPYVPYIPSSPITCGHFIEPGNENFGDTHYWQVWHGCKPFIEYRKHYFRYLSEFGFQSFPCEKTVRQFTLPEDRNIFSRVMEQHQRNTGANAKIISYLSETFLYPTDFGALLYASQLLQAEAMRCGVEQMRRNRGRCMGTLYWQLNDIWPVASWASIDYYGRLKALHYYAKRFYSPVLLSCMEIGEKDTRPFVILDPGDYDYETKAQLDLTNDTRSDVQGKVVVCLRNSRGEVLCSYEYEATVPALSAKTVASIDFNKTDVRNNYMSYEFIVDGEVVSSGTALFTAPKHFDFISPNLEARIEGDEIVVSADAYAKSVEIYSDDSDFILSDNFFDINSGEVRVKILEGTPTNVKLRSVYDIR